MSEPLVFVEISPQLNDVYTGIGNVNHQIISWFRRERRAETVFFCHDDVMHEEVVDEILLRRNGRGLRDLFHRGLVSNGSLASALERATGRTTAGLFSTAKTHRGVFTYEAQVIHDLTVQLMPEVHHQNTIERHGTTLEADLASDDLVVCVSQNTCDDLRLYLGVAPERMLVAHLGVDDVDVVARAGDVEPFILVLGTVEPRKNVSLVLAALRARPDLLDRWRFVFVGPDGWGDSFATLLDAHGLDAHRGNRILQLGFVSDAVRNSLLANASCLVYPSFYEGFGLPVIEALHAGCAVITSNSSSLPEVGGPVATYVDPYAPAGLVQALEALPRDEGGPAVQRERDARRAWASAFTWDRFCRSIDARMRDDLAALSRAGATRGARSRVGEWA